jgi:hypothetical protein
VDGHVPHDLAGAMALLRSTPPIESLRALQGGISDVSNLENASRGSDSSLAPDDIRAVPLYVMDLAALARDEPVGLAATQRGWRYLMRGTDGITGTDVAEYDGQHRVVLVSSARFNARIAGTVDAAPDLVASASIDYELRYLLVPGLCMLLLWLEGAKPGEGLLLPLPPTGLKTLRRRLYREDEFLSIARPLAERRLARPDPP